METFPYSADPPETREQYISQTEEISRAGGAGRFLIVRLSGPAMADIAHLVHNAGPGADGRLGETRHWSVDRMVEAMRAARAPKLFGPGGLPGMEIEGFEFGVCAIARSEAGACIVFFGTEAEITSEDQMCTLMASAHITAEQGLCTLKGRPPRACPLTDRELGCLVAYMETQGNKQAAAALGISIKTLENHLERVRIKCGVDSTLAATVVAVKEGWVSWPGVRASAGGG